MISRGTIGYYRTLIGWLLSVMAFVAEGDELESLEHISPQPETVRIELVLEDTEQSDSAAPLERVGAVRPQPNKDTAQSVEPLKRPSAIRPEQEEATPPSGEIMEIPAVVDRPFDIDEGDLIAIKKFRLLDANDLPEHDIYLDQIHELLEQKIAEKPEGYTIGQLQTIADVVTDYYRSRGLILAQVVIPIQTIEENTVDLQVFVGIMGRVLVEGNEIYDLSIFQAVFRDLIGKPISQKKTEAILLELTEYPGLTVFGVFNPGQQVGTADIVLNVQEEKRFDVALRTDSGGTQQTGRARLRAVVDWNNITGGADKATVSVQQSYNPKNSTYLAFDYQRHLPGGYVWSTSFTRNVFSVGGEFAASGITAESENFSIGLNRSFITGRQRNFLGYAGFALKSSKTFARGSLASLDTLSVFSFGINYDSVDGFNLQHIPGEGGGINFANLEVSQGINDFIGSIDSHSSSQSLPSGLRPSRQGGPPASLYGEGLFTKVFGSYSRLQTLTDQQSLLIRSEFQWSDDLLLPLEQYSIGGPNNVRAFPIAQTLLDRAYFLSFEWLVNAPLIGEFQGFSNRTWGELLQLGIFYDFAVGRLNQPLPGVAQSSQNFKGAGFGFRFNVPGTFESKLAWAWEVGGTPVNNNRQPQLWFDATWRF